MGLGVDVDRCAGVLVGLACGDALGAGYEFGRPPMEGEARMIGGGLGGWDVGEWTDDTQMAICIARETETGSCDVDAVGGQFLDWFRSGPADVGNQTLAVLSQATGPGDVAVRAAAYFAANPHAGAGNGSLMRTAPVALACLGDDRALVGMATRVSALTHADPLTGEACILWCAAIDRAIRESRLDGIDDGVELLPADRREFWAARIDEARTQPPSTFSPNGYVVTALQAALAAVTQTPVPGEEPARHLRLALQAAVAVGDDTDTVAAIAGALLGARWGATAIPPEWTAVLHGWPGMHAGDLIRLGVLSATHGVSDDAGWPAADTLASHYEPVRPLAVPLTDDPGVILANMAGAHTVSADVVVSLCRVGAHELDAGLHARILLMDSDRPGDNPNLTVLFADLAAAVAGWRDEGRTVVIHCVHAQRRTPAVAAGYLAHRLDIPAQEALRRVSRDLPGMLTNQAFVDALTDIWPTAAPPPPAAPSHPRERVPLPERPVWRWEQVFRPSPEQWGLRGDPFAYQAIEGHLSGIDVPATLDEATEQLYRAFKEVVGVDLRDTSAPDELQHGKFSHGEVSSRPIHLPTWREHHMPTLLARVRAQIEPGGGAPAAEVTVFHERIRPFARAIQEKQSLLGSATTLSVRQQARVRESMSDDLRKCCEILIPDVRRPDVSEAARLKAADLGLPGLDLRDETWHTQPRFDPRRQFFLLEHVVPINTLRDGCVAAASVDEAIEFLWRNVRLAWILKVEDHRLTDLGYRKHRQNPLLAYAEAGIKLV